MLLLNIMNLLLRNTELQDGFSKAFQPPERPGLYIHLPFCKSLCSFCPYVKTPFDQATSRDYARLIMKELALYEFSEFTSLYIGGGTPTADIHALCDIISKTRVMVEKEVAVEVHPLDATSGNLQELKTAGVDYVSIGAQSFTSNALEDFGRNHTSTDARNAVCNAVGTGFGAVDVDLVFDLKRQPEDTVFSDFLQTLEIGPSQISVYPMMRFDQAGRMEEKHDWRRESKVFETLEEYARKADYRRNSLWTFARKDWSGRYSSITRPFFLGLGISAASFDGASFSVNTSSLSEYMLSVGRGKKPAQRHAELSQFASCLYYSFWALYRGKLEHSEARKFFPGVWRRLNLLLMTQKVAGNVRRTAEETVLTRKGRTAFHRIEEWVTYKFIDPLWTEMKHQTDLGKNCPDTCSSLQ